MEKLKRILLTLSPELLQILDHDLPQRSRNPLIEDLLWKTTYIRRKSKELNIPRVGRNKDGGYDRNKQRRRENKKRK